MINFLKRLFGIHVHMWSMLEAPVPRIVCDLGDDFVGLPASDFQVLEQRRVCLTCGRVDWVRIE